MSYPFMKQNLAESLDPQNSFKVSNYMTPLPFTVTLETSLLEAKTIMHDNSLSHLPVMDEDNHVHGMITERDIDLIESFWSDDPSEVKVSDFVVPHPLCVAPETAVRDVCSLMAFKKADSVLVLDHKELVGIFTWVDALGALSGILDDHLR